MKKAGGWSARVQHSLSHDELLAVAQDLADSIEHAAWNELLHDKTPHMIHAVWSFQEWKKRNNA